MYILVRYGTVSRDSPAFIRPRSHRTVRTTYGAPPSANIVWFPASLLSCREASTLPVVGRHEAVQFETRRRSRSGRWCDTHELREWSGRLNIRLRMPVSVCSPFFDVIIGRGFRISFGDGRLTMPRNRAYSPRAQRNGAAPVLRSSPGTGRLDNPSELYSRCIGFYRGRGRARRAPSKLGRARSIDLGAAPPYARAAHVDEGRRRVTASLRPWLDAAHTRHASCELRSGRRGRGRGSAAGGRRRPCYFALRRMHRARSGGG